MQTAFSLTARKTFNWGGNYAFWRQVESMGRLCLLYAAGDEGGARFLRCHDTFRSSRHFGSDSLEARHPLGGGQDTRPAPH